jgi:hypothetical protein
LPRFEYEHCGPVAAESRRHAAFDTVAWDCVNDLFEASAEAGIVAKIWLMRSAQSDLVLSAVSLIAWNVHGGSKS